MKTLEQQVSGKCKHFSGIMDKCCRVGILYEDVRDNNTRPYTFPCFKDSGLHTCPMVEFKTQTEVEAELKEINEMTEKTIGVLMKIKKGNATKGAVPCSCGGTVHYVRAQLNGHVHAKCDSCGLSIME